MKVRQGRIRRLMALREQEHASALERLQLARRALARAEEGVLEHAQALQRYETDQSAALEDGCHELWRMTRAESALCVLAMTHAERQQRSLEQDMLMAAAHGQAARRVFHQMEHLVLREEQEERLLQSRKAQQQLDEVGRGLQSRANRWIVP